MAWQLSLSQQQDLIALPYLIGSASNCCISISLIWRKCQYPAKVMFQKLLRNNNGWANSVVDASARPPTKSTAVKVNTKCSTLTTVICTNLGWALDMLFKDQYNMILALLRWTWAKVLAEPRHSVWTISSPQSTSVWAFAIIDWTRTSPSHIVSYRTFSKLSLWWF